MLNTTDNKMEPKVKQQQYVFNQFGDKKYVDCTIFQFGWQKCDPLHSFGPAVRNHYLFHYIISGQGTLVSTNSKNEDYTYQIRAGQGFLISPGQRNHYFADELQPWEYAWVEFDGIKAQEFVNLAGLDYDSPVYTSNLPSMQQVVREELLYIAHHGNESDMNLIGHMYLFMDALQKSSARRKTSIGKNLKDYYINEAIQFIENNYVNAITVEDVAAYCNLNRSYFGKIFKDTLRITPQEFLINYRITKACEYLETTNLLIGEISGLVGYPSQLHFSRAFKKINGISPREWRLTHMKK